MAAGRQPRPLRVGASALVDRDLIGRMFEAASAVEPDYDVVLRTAAVTELRHALAEAELDLLLVPAGEAAPDVRRETVALVPLVFLAARSAPGMPGATETAPIELRDTTATQLILPTDACGLAPFTRSLFADNGLQMTTYPGQTHDCRSLQEWVALGLGSALLPGTKVIEGTPARPVHVRDVPVTIAYDACWLANSPLHAQVAGIVEKLTTAV